MAVTNPNDKMQRLSSLAAAYPAMDAQAAAREKAALDLQIGQATAAAAPTGNIRAASQQIAGAATQAQGALATQQQQTAQKNLGQLGQMAVEQQQAEGSAQLANQTRTQNMQLATSGLASQMATQKADLASRKTLTEADIAAKQRMEASGLAVDSRLNATSIKQREDLARLGRDVKSELFDKNLAFEKDEVGRKFSNERQLADYAVASAKSDIELKNKMAAMERADRLETIMLEAAMNKITQEMKQASSTRIREGNQTAKLDLASYKAAIEKRIAAKKAAASSRAAIFEGVGMVVGAGIGFVATGGNPLGAMAGAQMGAGAGKAAAGT